MNKFTGISNTNSTAASEEDPIEIPMDRYAWVTPVVLVGAIAFVAYAFFSLIV